MALEAGGEKRDCDQEAERGQGWEYNLIFVGLQGRAQALPRPAGCSSSEMGVGAEWSAQGCCAH